MSRHSRSKQARHKAATGAALAVSSARLLYLDTQGQLHAGAPLQTLPQLLADAGCTLWLDLANTPLAEAERLLREVFGFHPLLVEDIVHTSDVPKVNDFGAYLQLVLHGVRFKREEQALDTDEVDLVLGPNYLVTHHLDQVPALERLWDACVRDGRPLGGGADHMAYELVDLLVADYLPVIDELDEATDALEDEVFTNPTPQTLDRIFRLKRAALHLRRIIAPQREVANRLARDAYPVIDERDQVYFRNVYDQLVRLYDLNEALRDLISGALDTYLSVTSYRINEIMKILTIFTAMFMPISFLAGFFGMNFVHLPFDRPWMLAIAVGLMVASPIVMTTYFRRRGWL